MNNRGTHPIFERRRIFAPGPTPVPEEVLAVLGQSPLHHRTREFAAVLDRVQENLQFLFQTKKRCALLSSSGTGAVECAVTNCFVPGDEVLVIDGGKFGERFGLMCERFGLRVHRLTVPWGEAVEPSAVEAALKAHPEIRGVLFQASETSTAVAHPTEAISRTVHKHSKALVVVDAITALGVYDLPMDAWGLDVVISGSQKALMLPPGIAFLALSDRAVEARKRKGTPRFYFDLDYDDEASKGGETPWTAAVGLVIGLDLVLQRLRERGLEPLFAHTRLLAEGMRAGAQGMGLELFAKKSPSDALTAVHIPAKVDGKKLINRMRDQYGVTVAGGQDAWTGKMLRLAHLGWYDQLDVLTILGTLEMALASEGYGAPKGAGVAAAQRHFLR